MSSGVDAPSSGRLSSARDRLSAFAAKSKATLVESKDRAKERMAEGKEKLLESKDKYKDKLKEGGAKCKEKFIEGKEKLIEHKDRLMERAGASNSADKYRVLTTDLPGSHDGRTSTYEPLPTSSNAGVRGGEGTAEAHIVYAFVARGSTCLAEAVRDGASPEALLEARAVATKFLGKDVPPGWDDHRDYFGKSKMRGTRLGVHTSSDSGLQFACMYDASFPKDTVKKFIEKVVLLSMPLHKDEWDAAKVSYLSAQVNFGGILHQQLQLFTSREEEMAKIRKVHQQVDEVKGILADNVEKILQRGEKLEDLEARSEELTQSATMFQKGAKSFKRWHYMNQAKLGVAAGTAITASVAIPIVVLTAL